MRYGLKDETVDKICEVLAGHPEVESAILYGSRAKGNYRNGSDIDMTLTGEKDLDRKILYRIMDEIDDLLLPYTFDLSLCRDIGDADVIDHIRRKGVLFYKKKIS